MRSPRAVVVVGALLCLLGHAAAFLHTSLAVRPGVCVRQFTACKPLQASSGLFGFGGPSIPRSIKDGVTAMRQSLQQALKARQSRMEVVLPRGTALGVESPNVDKGASLVDRADRELARLFVEMFKPVINATVVVFPTNSEARRAQNLWNPECEVSVISFEDVKAKGGAKGKKKRSGFGGINVAASILPPSTEVLISVAPGPQELEIIRKLSETLGMDTLIVILNTQLQEVGGLSQEDKSYLMEAFETVFLLRPVAAKGNIDTEDNMLLYRAYPEPWKFVQKGIGAPYVLAEKDKPFEMSELFELLKKGQEYNQKGLLNKLQTSLFGRGK